MLNNIEAERARNRMTKEVLCEKLEITPKTYNCYIDGIHPTPHTVLVKLHELFGCTVDYLLGLTETRT